MQGGTLVGVLCLFLCVSSIVAVPEGEFPKFSEGFVPTQMAMHGENAALIAVS